jgi:predicted SAM-dependent methyltransferase
VGRLARVTSVGRCTKQELVALIMEPEIICDGATLEAVGDASLDFVIANHLLEHMADPLKGLENWIRVLRSGGILYLAVPDTAEELVALAEKRYGVKTLESHNDQESNELVWILRKTLTGSRGQRSSTGNGAR